MRLSFVHYLPILTTILSGFFALSVYRRYQARGGNHLWWWSFGILVYGMGTFAESWMTVLGWNPVIFKFWYVVGALMGGAPLAQGTVWLLMRERTARVLTRALIIAISIPAVFVLLSPINYDAVDPHVPGGAAFAWQWVRLFSPFINTYAVIFLIGGAFYSAWRFGVAARGGGFGPSVARDRFVGNVLIATGAILPGIGGAASRMGHTEWLYAGEFVGILLIWSGYWMNIRRRPVAESKTARAVVTAALVACLLAPFSALAQDPGELVVQAIAPDGLPLAGATIVVTRAGAAVAEADTDAAGKWQQSMPAAGDYLVTVAAEGFVPYVRQLRLSAGQRHVVTARLQIAPLEERVTVAATLTERGEFEVPGEVSIIGRQELDLVQARSLDDVFRYVPGVEMTDTARRLGQTVNIRGFDEKRVLTLRDGARVAQYNSAHKGTGFFDAEDISSVEVVKGASSALYGSGAIGGVVSVTTRDPGDFLTPGSSIGAGLRTSYSSAYSDLMFTPRLFGQTRSGLGWLVSYTGRRNDGTVRLAGEPSELTRGEEDIDSFVARMTTPLSDRSALRLSVDHYGQRGASLTNLSVVEPGPATAVDRETGQTSVNARFNRTGGSWLDSDLSVTAYFNAMGIDETRVFDQRVDDIDYRTWGIDARNTARLGSTHTFTFGAEYVDDRQKARRNGDPNGFFPDGDRRQLGLFVQDEIELVEGRLLIVPGLRFDHFDSRADDPEIAAQTFDRLSPKLGATYQLTSAVTASASYGHGFRAPLFQELFPTGVHFAFPAGPYFFLALFEPNTELLPERSRNWDAGLRVAAGSVRARVAYWESRVEDFIDLLPVQTLPPTRGVIIQRWQSLNRQDALLRGGEASVDWQPHTDWLVRAGYSVARGTDRASGEALLQLPQDALVLGLDWSRSDAGTQVSWATRVYGDRNNVPTGVEPAAGYVLHDLHLRWSPRFLSQVSVFASVNNLADTEYEDPRFGTPGVGRDLRFGFGIGF
jgi:hemoglobin/transferrin/lactoferrin receptor protein